MKKKATDKEYICGVIKNYLLIEVLDKMKETPKCREIVSIMFTLRKSVINEFCEAIYSQKEVITSEQLLEYLNSYVDSLCAAFKDIDPDKDAVEIVKTQKGRSDYFKACIETSRATVNDRFTNASEEFYNEQNEILKIYRDLVFSLGINDTLSLSHYFAYLLWNGYFSISNKHVYRMKDRIISNMFSLEVFQGRGVCLNYSYLLQEFLTICGKDAQLIICDVDSSQIERKEEDKVNIERAFDITISDRMKYFLLAPIMINKKNSGNHAINMIYGEKGPYYYDSTNLFVMNINGKDSATLINGDGTIPIKLNSTFSPPKSHNIREKLLDLVIRNKSFDIYTKDEIKTSYDNMINYLNSNKELLSKTYFMARPHIEKICQQINLNREDFTFSGMVRKLFRQYHEEREKKS